MKKNVFVMIFVTLMFIVSVPVFTQAFTEVQREEADSQVVIASTSWVSAMAEAAGVHVTKILAPLELRHPPEYDFRPSDIITAAEADVLLWAGYESFMNELAQAAKIPEEKIIKVSTNNSPDLLRVSVSNLASRLKTEEYLNDWLKELDEFELAVLNNTKLHNTGKIKAAVQFHHQSLAKWLGYDVVAVFGPEELTLGQLQTIEALQPQIIIDNWHNASGQSLATAGRTYVQLINFPGQGETTSILEVLRYNMELLGLL
ncbi:MAG: hypothetical protein PHU24_01805 [Sphaerochaetaceae bacterium]|nr:hypothetical protein [Sphaerochaetaceae bacterium]NLO60099.1 hypothetical protein [Spirochaetales bacterium]MDD2405172.1 hypothetical protein [Sphaerochaetaceae bacterium]MDD4259334.1 hypothetical protein [Sphaerochaetaceae bacterium]MDD4764165.1 hypothetical protein [Sphaerochaetaceae bacterium]